MSEQKPLSESDELTVRWMKKLLVGLGAGFVVFGVIRQWPVLGKTYMEFIEGDGYLSLILGLIMIILGFSVRLLIEPSGEDPEP